MSTRPMMPSDVHEHMREVVEADVLDMSAIGARLAHVERIRTNWASHDGESRRAALVAAEWHEAYASARRYVEQTLERRGCLGAAVVDLAIEQGQAADRERGLKTLVRGLRQRLE